MYLSGLGGPKHLPLCSRRLLRPWWVTFYSGTLPSHPKPVALGRKHVYKIPIGRGPNQRLSTLFPFIRLSFLIAWLLTSLHQRTVQLNRSSWVDRFPQHCHCAAPSYLNPLVGNFWEASCYRQWKNVRLRAPNQRSRATLQHV